MTWVLAFMAVGTCLMALAVPLWIIGLMNQGR